MRLDRSIMKLPLAFDAERLAAEVRALPPGAWERHPMGFPGNDAVALVSPGGQINDHFRGEMAPTEYLLQCRYIQEVMAAIGGVWGRSRLMGLAAGAEVPPHVDIHYYWRTHLRIHIPVITNPEVIFTCGETSVHMEPGEAWIFDSFEEHVVRNGGEDHRVHLVLDTVGGGRVWDLVEAANAGDQDWGTVVPGATPDDQLAFEKLNVPEVMSPWEMRCHGAFLLSQSMAHPKLEAVAELLDHLSDDWAAAWVQFGQDDQGLPTYRRLLMRTRQEMQQAGAGDVLLKNNHPLYVGIERLILRHALAPDGSNPQQAAGEPRARLAS
ncbi:MAG: aspartyl/asparaginyl beta-hydroxylase domain-containing protein [Sphingomicrobium sp.]